MNTVLLAALGAALTVAAPTPRSIMAELERLDRDLLAREERLLTLETQNAALRAELARIESELAATRIRQKEVFVDYQVRLRALSRMPEGARLALLGGSRSLRDFLEAARVLRWIAAHDRTLGEQMRERREALGELEARLSARQGELEKTITGVREERERLAGARQERLVLLESVGKDRDLSRLAAGERTRAGRELQVMLQRLEPAGAANRRFSSQRGKLPWPTAGRLEVRFGQRVEVDYGTSTTHPGWDVRAALGTPVQAIFAGEVVFADWLKGYGQIVIVNHGEHYHSLVAHLGRVDVRAGQPVAQGDLLGTVGDTGSLRGALLYFELRQRGAPVDPAEWLRR